MLDIKCFNIHTNHIKNICVILLFRIRGSSLFRQVFLCSLSHVGCLNTPVTIKKKKKTCNKPSNVWMLLLFWKKPKPKASDMGNGNIPASACMIQDLSTQEEKGTNQVLQLLLKSAFVPGMISCCWAWVCRQPWKNIRMIDLPLRGTSGETQKFYQTHIHLHHPRTYYPQERWCAYKHRLMSLMYLPAPRWIQSKSPA